MLYLSVAALGLTFFSLNAAAVPLASPEAIASLVANLPTDHAAGLASLIARGNDPSTLGSLLDKRQNSSLSAQNSTLIAQNSSMSALIDAYIVNLQQAGYVPNANATTPSKRDNTLISLEPLIEKRSVPSVPLVIALLGQHGFVPVANGTDDDDDDGTTAASPSSSKRAAVLTDLDASAALQKRAVPDIDLVVSRLAAHGFVPSGASANSSAMARKRDATGEINTVISQLEALGFNPGDFMQQQRGNASTTTTTTTQSVNASGVSKRASRWSFRKGSGGGI